MILRARDNPFATQRVEALLAFDPEWLGTTWPRILTDLQKNDFRGAIVGPHGSGKTTFLEALAPRLARRDLRTRHYFFNDRCRPSIDLETDPETVVIVDGAERLGFSDWRRLRRQRRLIVTCHRGFRLPTLLRTRTTPQMLAAFARMLAPDLAIDAERLYRKHRGNLREALRECYDLANCHHVPS